MVTADEAEHAARKLVEMDAREKQKAAARKVAEEEAKAAAVKKAQAAVQLQPKGTQEPRKDPGPRPPAGARVTRQPPLIVRKITRGSSGKR